MNIYLTALVKCKPGTVVQMKTLLHELVAASTKESACLQYDLHQSLQDENQFIFHENWQDQEGLDLHNQQPHLQQFAKQSASILDGPVIIHKTKKIS